MAVKKKIYFFSEQKTNRGLWGIFKKKISWNKPKKRHSKKHSIS